MAQHSGDKPWWREATSVALTHHETRNEAKAAELAAIRTENPVHNVAGRVRERLPKIARHDGVCIDPDRIIDLETGRLRAGDMVGAAEIAGRPGAKRATVVHDWRRRHPDFPQPVATLSAGLVWAWPDVEKWAKATGREIAGT